MVTATEGPANADQGGICLFAGEVGRDLPRHHDFTVALRPAELLHRQTEVLRHHGDNLLRLKDALRVRIDRLTQDTRGQLHRYRHSA